MTNSGVAPHTGPSRKPNDLRGRRRAELISNVHRIAVRKFASQGFDNTSLNEICQAADISVRTFFRHFAGKDDLLRIVKRNLQDVVLDNLRNEPDDSAFPDALATAVAQGYESLYQDDRQYAADCLNLLTTKYAIAATYAAVTDTSQVNDMDREFGRRLGMNPSDGQIRLLRWFVTAAVDHAVSEWTSDNQVDLQPALRRNLELINWPTRELSVRA